MEARKLTLYLHPASSRIYAYTTHTQNIGHAAVGELMPNIGASRESCSESEIYITILKLNIIIYFSAKQISIHALGSTAFITPINL